MSLIKHHDRFLGEFLGHQVGDLRVQQVVVAVHHDVSVEDLKGTKTETFKQLKANLPYANYCLMCGYL